MTKIFLKRMLPMLMAMCVLMSIPVFAATTYHIEVTLSGPDANGATKSVSGTSSKYGSLSSPLTVEVVTVFNDNMDEIKTVFAKTGLSQIVSDGLKAHDNGGSSWESYVNKYYSDVTGDFKSILSDLDSTLSDLKVNKENEISYLAENGKKYTVTVTLRNNVSGCSKDKSCPAGKMADLNLKDWYHDGVHYCMDNDLMDGYGNGKFGPYDNLTRSQIAQILYNLEGNPAVSFKDTFDDVKASAWYASAVIWANEAGVVKGYGNGKFGSDDLITREQLATMLYRYTEYKGYGINYNVSSDFSKFPDANMVSSWALKEVKWAHAEMLITGTGAGTLNPLGFATRTEAATVLMRFCENVAG